MSKSRAYRTMYLTEEQRAELVACCRQERSLAGLAHLRTYLERELVAAFPAGDRMHELQGQIRGAADVGALRILFATLLGAPHVPLVQPADERLGTDALPLERFRIEPALTVHTPGGLIPQEAPGHGRPELPDSAPDSAPDAMALRFDAVRLRGELESIERSAGELGVDVASLVEARRLIESAIQAADRGWDATGSACLAQAKSLVDAVEKAVVEALVEAEARARTVDLATETLQALGYRVAAPQLFEGSTVITGLARDGSAAEVTVSGVSDDALELTSTFTDLGSAVPVGHPAADDLCERAVADQVQFAKRIASGDLGAGPIATGERPSRSSAADLAGQQRVRRRRSTSTPSKRRRG